MGYAWYVVFNRLFILSLCSSVLLGSLGCALISKTSNKKDPDDHTLARSVSRGPAPQQVEIIFKGTPGEKSETAYYSNAHTLNFTEGQLVRDHVEVVEFGVTTTTKAVRGDILETSVKTKFKDGTVDLHELAFPELGEEIGYILRKNGQILRAGIYSSQSIFFVPSLPIPKGAVAIGDTWPMEHMWISGRDRIPLKLQIIGILKDIVPCDVSGYCADIEVSGSVNLVLLPATQDVRFDSRVWGRLLFALDRGDVVWSEMRSREEMLVGKERTQVESCMVSKMALPPAAADSLHLECDSKEQPITKVPAI